MIKRSINHKEVENVVLKGDILEEYLDEKYLLVENVPADVCSKCGEKIYSPEVTEELLKFASEEIPPVRVKKVPVFDYAMKTQCFFLKNLHFSSIAVIKTYNCT